MSEHSQYVELCAFYASGTISDEQLAALDSHLVGCGDCRRALEEFQVIASMGLPSLAPEFADVSPTSTVAASDSRIQQRLLARIENAIIARPRISVTGAQSMPMKHIKRHPWPRVLQYAAAFSVAAAMSIYTYRLGERRATEVSQPALQHAESNAILLKKQLALLTAERDILHSRLQDTNRAVSTLSTQIGERQNQIANFERRQSELSDAAMSNQLKIAAGESERGALSKKLADAQTALIDLQHAFESARAEQAVSLVQVANLEKRLKETSAALTDRDETIRQQHELLAYDRDIRDLIGARDLYVAEVNDIDRDAKTKTPFGRVFYTKHKSLIFYAYDLDRQAGLHRASAFQAWGRRGPDFTQALPLGILYLDQGTNKRWVLKFDDPQLLAKIDAVFVTIEPKGGSQRPSGKPLLFAYLNVEPNHP